MIALKDYEKAEKLIRKHQKKFPQDPSIRIDLGLLYDVQGKNNDAKKVYEEAINNLKPDINQVNLLGNAFAKNQMFDFAVATYLEGRKLLKGAYPFSFELAEAYGQLGKFTEMVNHY